MLDYDEGDKENLEIISTKGNVIQVKKTKVIVEQNTGRKRHQSSEETYINVTTKKPYKRRKITESEEPLPKLTPEALRFRSKKLKEAVDILSSNPEESAIVIANVVDQKNEEEGFSEPFKNESKMFKERNILNREEAADDMVRTHMSRQALRKQITGL